MFTMSFVFDVIFLVIESYKFVDSLFSTYQNNYREIMSNFPTNVKMTTHPFLYERYCEWVRYFEGDTNYIAVKFHEFFVQGAKSAL